MKMGNRIVILILFLFALLGCEHIQSDDASFYSYIPQDAQLVYKIIPEDSTAITLQTITESFKKNSLLSETKGGILNFDLAKNPVLNQVKIVNETLLIFSKSDSTRSNYTLITKQPKQLFSLDSLKDKNVELLQIEKNGVTKVSFNKEEIFYAIVDSSLVVSSSIIAVKNILSKKVFSDSSFQQLVRMPSKDGLTIIKKDTDKNSWTSVYLTEKETEIQAVGILMARDSVNSTFDFLKGQVPQEMTMAYSLPNNIEKAIVFTYSDAELFVENLRKSNRDTLKLVSLDLIASFNEIAHVSWKGDTFVIAKSMDSQIAMESLEAKISEVKQFRNTTIYKFNVPNYFNPIFRPFGLSSNTTFMFEKDGYFIFCPSEISAEKINTAIISDAVLLKSTAFKDILPNITRSITYAEIAVKEEVPTLLNRYIGATEKNIAFKKAKGYDLGITQYSVENTFTHINFVAVETDNQTTTVQSVSTPVAFTVKAPILGNPAFFTSRGNYRKNVAIQDITNTLRGYTSDGTLIWSKKLNNPILGDIKEVDIKRNGRKQLAFVTKNKMYVVDENGKDAAPFPITFKDQITQPLAVFDYDNNRKYRFVITQGKEVVMLDSKAKTVKGFTFKKATSTIVATPQHIRLGNKDYLLFQEQNGKLNILSRTGKERIKVSQTFTFNGSNVQQNANSFVLITANNEQKTISQSGKVTTKKLNVETDYTMILDAKMTVSLNDNKLQINNKLIELPFGIYTKPRVFYLHKVGYVTFTETQENKVYVYKANGGLVNGFPVFGTDQATMSTISKLKSLQLLVAGDANELLLYTIK